jgi:carbon dioxide concentrating mechanism protein CcmN
MSVPPLRLNNNFDPYISGEVTIHPSAVIAPGVILQAAVNSNIIIGSGVCVGMGSILQVDEGTLEVKAGANLGAGFLMVGKGTIGANACIGSATTVFQCSVEPGLVVPPGSVLGDTSRQIGETKELEPVEPSTNDSSSTDVQKPTAEDNGVDEGKEQVISATNLSVSAFLEFKHQSITFAKFSPNQESQSSQVEENTNGASPPDVNSENLESSQPVTESSDIFGSQIYGQGSIHRLLTTLFPHRQSLNNPVSDNQSE